MIGCSFSAGPSSEPPSFSSGCHKTRGSTPGGSSILRGSSSFAGASGIGVFVIEVSGDLEQPHGIKRFRAERRRRSSMLEPEEALGHGDLNGLLITTAASDTVRTFGSNACLFTCTSPLPHTIIGQPMHVLPAITST